MNYRQYRTLEYIEPSLEQAWLEHRKPQLISILKWAAFAAIIVSVLASARDFFLQWDGWLHPLAFRWLIIIPLVCTPAILTNTTRGIQRVHDIMFVFIGGVWLALMLIFRFSPALDPVLKVNTALLFVPVQAIVIALFPMGLRRIILLAMIGIAMFALVIINVPMALLHRMMSFHAVIGTSIVLIIASGLLEYQSRANWLTTRMLNEEQYKSRKLLLSILPDNIADRLIAGESPIADHVDEAIVLFADIVGFTAMSTKFPPEVIVRRLNIIFSEFDDLAKQHGFTKIKTIGDAYMAVSGLPWSMPGDQISAAVRFGQDILDTIHHHEGVAIRVGIHAGPAVAGVIGKDKFIYDIWGETVNLASRMESTGEPGRIQVSSFIEQMSDPSIQFTKRSSVAIKGMGTRDTYWVCDTTTHST